MLRGAIDGVSPDEAQASATLADIRKFCGQRPTIYLPAHDPQSKQRLQERRSVMVHEFSRSGAAVDFSLPTKAAA
jgi:hypothetical protein